MSQQPNRVVLYDKDGNVLHDADTPEQVTEVLRHVEVVSVSLNHPKEKP